MMPHRLIPVFLGVLGFALATGTPVVASDSTFAPEVGQICRAQTREAEKRHRLPKLVLSAISLAKAGGGTPANAEVTPGLGR